MTDFSKYKMEFSEYANSTGLNASVLKRRARSSWRHVQSDQPRDSAEFALGRAVHCAVLEPLTLPARYGQLPSAEGIKTKTGKPAKNPEATSDYKELVEAQRAANPQMDYLTKKQWENVMGMASAVRKSKKAQALLNGCEMELSLHWDMPTLVAGAPGKIPCKTRPDALNLEASRPRLVELKSTHDANPYVFTRQCRNLDYAMQLAFQSFGVLAEFQVQIRDFNIIAVESTFPWTVSIHEITKATISDEEVRCIELIDEYAQLPDIGDWPGYGDEINVIDFSRGDA